MKKITNYLLEKLNFLKIPFDKFEFLAGDASNRKYFKISLDNSSKILMYEKNGKKNIENFIYKTKLFQSSGIKVPKIFNNFLEYDILIIEDFGEKKYSQIINFKNELKLYKSALDSLLFIHKKEPSESLDLYSEKIFFEESKLFFDWYLKLYSRKKKYNLLQFEDFFLESLLILKKLPVVNVHRDFHVDNLFFFESELKERRCGWIDYQDALKGPCTYDVMSLLEDARRELNFGNIKKLISYYLNELKFLDPELFIQSFKLIAIQRHLKVLGIFSRLALKDNKTGYIKHIPRVTNMLISNLNEKKFKKINSILRPLISL